MCFVTPPTQLELVVDLSREAAKKSNIIKNQTATWLSSWGIRNILRSERIL